MGPDVGTLIHHRESKAADTLPPSILRVIENTYKDTESWTEELFLHAEKVTGHTYASSLGGQCDFYHDCIVQHLESNKVALTVIKEGEGAVDWTYEQLHKLVNYQVKEWNEKQLHSGQHIVIACPFSEYFVIAYLTAIRLGLKVCYLPTDTPELADPQILLKIHELQPSHIITTFEDFTIEADIPIMVFNDLRISGNNYTPTSHGYARDETLHIQLSEYGTEFAELFSVDAHTVMAGALTDGLIFMGLKPNVTWSAPLESHLQYPYVLLMVFLLGGRLLSISDQLITQNPEILKNHKIHTLGLSSRLFKLWTDHPGVPSSHLKCCYKTPFISDYQAWHGFKQLNKIEKVPVSNYVIDSVTGGLMLFSRPSVDMPDSMLLPAPATRWRLLDINESGAEAIADYGIFEINDFSTNLILAKVGSEYVISKALTCSREARSYPIHQVELITRHITDFEGVAIYVTPRSGAIATDFILLLVFVGPATSDEIAINKSAWTQKIHAYITRMVGSFYLPDQIDFLPFVPKIKDQRVDRNWCEAQYSHGLFHKKQQLPIYQTLGQLHKLARG